VLAEGYEHQIKKAEGEVRTLKKCSCLFKPCDATFHNTCTSTPFTLLEELKEGEYDLVRPTGLEPVTLGFEVSSRGL